MDEEKFGDMVRRLYKGRGYTIQTLAETVGVSDSTIENWLREGTTQKNARRIAEALGLDSSETNKLLRLAAGITDAQLPREEPKIRETYLRAIMRQYDFIQLVLSRTSKLPIDTTFQPLELESNTLKSPRVMMARNLDDELCKDRGKRIVILGNAGSGKTTFIKYLLLKQAKRALNDYSALIPIFIDLTWFAGLDITIQGNLLRVVNTLKLNPNSEKEYIMMLRTAVYEGRAFICLDGLDEVATSQEAFVKQISDQIPNNTYIMSSRMTNFKEEDLGKHLTGEWRIWDLKPLTPSLQQHWASQLLPKIQQLLHVSTEYEPTAFIDALNSPRTARWGESPLLFNLALVVFTETGMLPMNKHELYKSSIDRILKGNFKTRYRQLGALALELLLERKGRIFEEANIEIHIKKWGGNDDDIRYVINSGLLNMVATSYYRFLHPTFQEYLAAIFIAQKPEMQALEQVDRLLKQADDPACRQVIIELAYLTHEKNLSRETIEGELKEAVAQVTLNEDMLYEQLLTVWKKLKEEYQRQDAKNNPAATGISYIFEDLLILWGEKLCTFLIHGNPSLDGSVASSIAQVFERSSIDRSFAVNALITGMYRYNNKFRFIGALGKIGTEEAVEGLLNFLEQTIEYSTDSEIRKRLIRALGNHVEKVSFLLQNLPGRGQYSVENKRKAQQELQELNQKKSYNLEELKEVLTVVDKNGKPSDWQGIEEVADWLQHNGLRNAMVQEHLLEIIKMLESLLINHKTHYARNAASLALGEIGNKQTSALMIRVLENGEEKYEETVNVILSSLCRLTDRSQLDLHLEQSCTEKFKAIQRAYPTLGNEVRNTASYICQQLSQQA